MVAQSEVAVDKHETISTLEAVLGEKTRTLLFCFILLLGFGSELMLIRLNVESHAVGSTRESEGRREEYEDEEDFFLPHFIIDHPKKFLKSVSGSRTI
ncbi:hypothetical protein SCA6_020000 [Theobroma cacao]